MQGRELEGKAGPRKYIVARAGHGPDHIDGLGAALAVAAGIGGRQRRLAQHVEGVALIGHGVAAGPVYRLLDGAADDELAGHDAHGLGQGLADQRLAATRYQVAEIAPGIVFRLGLEIDHPAGQHQAPGAGVDKKRIAVAQVAEPVGAAEFVTDQTVGGVGVGNAQERLGQTHQHHALVAGKAILVQEGVEATGGPALVAHRTHQALGQSLGSQAFLRRRPGGLYQGIENGAFVGPVGGRHGCSRTAVIGPLVSKDHVLDVSFPASPLKRLSLFRSTPVP